MHFQQSEAWQKFQESLDRQTFLRSGDGWQYLAILEHGTGNSRLFCPYGPSADSLDGFRAALTSLITLGQQQNVSFLRVEPTSPDQADILKQLGWKKTSYQKLNPEHTRLIDLSLSKEDLLAQMSQPARNIYRNYHKKGLVIHQSTDPDDIDIFLGFIHQVADRTGMRPHSDTYLRTQAKALFPTGHAKLWIAKLDNKPIATAITFDDQTTRYYAHAGASSLPDHRKLNASTAIVTEAIVDAKQQGLETFDLYGITPDTDEQNPSWAGFTKFKKSFGGKDIAYGGTWDLPLKPLAYWSYRLYQSLRQKLR